MIASTYTGKEVYPTVRKTVFEIEWPHKLVHEGEQYTIGFRSAVRNSDDCPAMLYNLYGYKCNGEEILRCVWLYLDGSISY
jgi:hypothetical protein